MEDAADIQFEIDRIDVSLNINAVAEFPAIFRGQRVVDDHALPVALPRFDLVLWHLHVAEDLEKLVGIGAKARKKILRLLVFVDSLKPRYRHHGDDARNRCEFFRDSNRAR